MMLLHSSASQGQSSAVFYGGAKGGNLNESEGYTDHQRIYTSRTAREDAIPSEIINGLIPGQVMTDCSPHLSRDMPASVEETLKRNM